MKFSILLSLKFLHVFCGFAVLAWGMPAGRTAQLCLHDHRDGDARHGAELAWHVVEAQVSRRFGER